MTDYLKNLNEKQREAVLHKEGALLVVAGAGAGKTRVIVSRILNLIKEGVAPEKILAITFTNKAAGEMKGRVFGLLGREDFSPSFSNFSNLPFVSTFHSLGVFIMRENYKTIGTKKNFTILDSGDSLREIKKAVKEAGLDPKQWEARKVQKAISIYKSTGVDKEVEGGNFYERVIMRVWKIYEKNIEKENSFDFDDLLIWPVKLMKENEDILEKYRSKWTHIHIDEYQDTNNIQNELIKLLTSKHKNLCVVGDGDQTIYTWRDANIYNILNFDKEYPSCKTVLLEKNYRSTKTIICVANEIIKKNTLRKEKNLYTDNEDGSNVKLFTAFDEVHEANFIAERSRELIEEGNKPSEIAVFYRTNFQSRVLEEAFINANVPYQILGTRFFERKEVKDVLSFVKASMDPDSVSDFKRIINVPPKGIGKITLLKIFSGRENELTPAMGARVMEFRELLFRIREVVKKEKPSEVIKFVINETGLGKYVTDNSEEGKDRKYNLLELVAIAKKYDGMTFPEGIEKLIEDAALAADQDTLIKKSESVKLMTIHSSKGLEFDNVFISGLEEGLFPQNVRDNELTDTSEQEKEEEERRLFYVAITRARKRLFLSYAMSRSIFGEKSMSVPSEFLNDISDDFIENIEDEGNGHRVKTVYLE